jgi:hypothetical protein
MEMKTAAWYVGPPEEALQTAWDRYEDAQLPHELRTRLHNHQANAAEQYL